MVCLVFQFNIMVEKYWILFYSVTVQRWTANPMRACLFLHMVGFWSGLTNGPLMFCVWLNEKAICLTVVDESSCESSINDSVWPEEEHQRMFPSHTSTKLTWMHGMAVNPEMDKNRLDMLAWWRPRSVLLMSVLPFCFVYLGGNDRVM